LRDQLRLGLAAAARDARPQSRLVIAEAGASMTGLSIAFKRDGLPVKQATNELPDDFLARVHRYTRLLEQSGTRVTQVLLAVAAHADAQTILARHALARALLAWFSAGDERGELLFWVPAGDADARHELLALVEKLIVEEPIPKGVSVRVRFAACSPPPGASEPPWRAGS